MAERIGDTLAKLLPELSERDADVLNRMQTVSDTIGGQTAFFSNIVAESGIALTLLFQQDLGEDLPSVELSKISPVFRNLLISVQARTDYAGTSDGCGVRLNGDADANYAFSFVANGGSNTLTGQNEMNLGDVAAANSPAGAVDPLFAFMPLIGSNNPKSALSLTGAHTATNTYIIRATANWWSENDIVNKITFVPVAGNNFKAGSHFSIYGMH